MFTDETMVPLIKKKCMAVRKSDWSLQFSQFPVMTILYNEDNIFIKGYRTSLCDQAFVSQSAEKS